MDLTIFMNMLHVSSRHLASKVMQIQQWFGSITCDSSDAYIMQV